MAFVLAKSWRQCKCRRKRKSTPTTRAIPDNEKVEKFNTGALKLLK